MAKIIRTLVFSPGKKKKVFKSVISIFCCSSVSVGNISLHLQTLILPLIVIIQWDFLCFVCTRSLKTARAPHRDLISSSSSLSGMIWRNRTNRDRLNPEEQWQRLQQASRDPIIIKIINVTSGFKLNFTKLWEHGLFEWCLCCVSGPWSW